MQLFSINLSMSTLFVTGFYLLSRNLDLVKGDPFLLYIGIIFILHYYLKEHKLIYLIPGITLISAGISQIFIINKLLMGLNNQLIIAISIGFSQILIFIINRLTFDHQHLEDSQFYYWPLGIGITLLILSLIYHQGLESFFWHKLSVYWPIILLVLTISNKKSKKGKEKILKT